jgi:hypothetical protein
MALSKKATVEKSMGSWDAGSSQRNSSVVISGFVKPHPAGQKSPRSLD